MSKTLIVAGATGYGGWPANTLEGARACIAAPIDGIEIDIQMTADGHVVAHHDYRLKRSQTRLDGEWLTQTGPALKTLSLAELQRYDVGRSRPGSYEAEHYPHRESCDGARIPTLPALLEALNAAPGPRRLIYVEIKTEPQDLADAPDPAAVTEAVIADLEAADYVAAAKIIAFDWAVLRLTRTRRPALATAHLTVPPVLAGTVKRLENGDSPWADGFDPRHHGDSDLAAIKAHGGEEWSPHIVDITPARIAEAASLGLKVGPWGVGSAEDIRRMVALGVFSATVSGPDWG
jgi:glycerophosphoryl diester phosphodiesterase